MLSSSKWSFQHMSLFCNVATAIHFCTAFISFIRGELIGLQYVSEHPKHGAPGTANYIDARTRWFDAAVQTASKQGMKQIVVIAAGFDSRAYRFHAPGLQASNTFVAMLLVCLLLSVVLRTKPTGKTSVAPISHVCPMPALCVLQAPVHFKI